MDENRTMFDTNNTDTENSGYVLSTLDVYDKSYLVSKIIAIVMGLPMNIMVAALVSTQRHLRNITNLYILERALAHILILLIGPYSIAAFLVKGSPAGHIMCYMHPVIAYSGEFVSSIFLVLLIIDCYLISRPKHHSLQYRWKVFKVASGVAWCAGVILAILVVFLTVAHKHDDDGFYYCQWKVFLPYPYKGILYPFIVFVLIMIPTIVAWVFVSFIYPSGSGGVTENETMESSEGEREESVTSLRSLSLALVISVTVCQVPLGISEIINDLIYDKNATHVLLVLYQMLYILSPILYLWFRKDLWQRLKICCSSRSTSNIPLRDL